MELSNFRAAAVNYRRAATICNNSFERRIFASFNAAAAYLNTDDYKEADTQLTISLAMIKAEAAAGTTPPELLKGYRVDALLISAKAFQRIGHYSESLPLYEENLAYYESINDSDNLIDCLSFLCEIGMSFLCEIFSKQGLPEKAFCIVQRAPSLNLHNAKSFDRLSQMWYQMKKYDKALGCAQKALECEERESGNNSAQYAVLQTRIGTKYSKLGRNDVALK